MDKNTLYEKKKRLVEIQKSSVTNKSRFRAFHTTDDDGRILLVFIYVLHFTMCIWILRDKT